jgi:pimeloyl-ACP methyl ester carboxylesterase
VAALADHLGLGRFAVMGISSGGPYVAVCAALLPERVASAAIVAGVTDFGWADAWRGFAEWKGAVMRLGNEADARNWCEQQFGADGSRFFEAVADDPMAPADEAFLGDEAVMGWMSATFSEAFRQGVGGYAQDTIVQGQPWAFDLRAIEAPVLVVHGAADTLAPSAHARHTAELIPDATLRILPDQGHISLFDELPRITAELGESLR